MESSLFLLAFVWIIVTITRTLAKQAKEQAAKNARATNAAPQKQQKAPKEKAPEPESVMVSEEGYFFRPTVMQPTISVSEHDDSVYQGSMNANTGEGYDPCHEEQLAPLSAAEAMEPVTETAPGLQLSWTGSDIVNGIVMSEILKRKK